MSTFTWSPSAATLTQQPRVRTASFGDGYQQRVADGINTAPRSWSLQFDGLAEQIDAIEAFLNARAGVESFSWTPPTGDAGKWICQTFNRQVPYFSVGTISATFIEVFGD